MPNALTAHVGLKIGPVLLETFFKHFVERKREVEGPNGSATRNEELIWHEAFQVVKTFMDEATKHTVEEIQEFSNSRIPTPPWIFVERVMIPISKCDEAAQYLIEGLGGEEMAKRVVGGTKWWQVRGIHGIDCQWICQKAHLQKAKKERKARNGSMDSGPFSPLGSRFSMSKPSKHHNGKSHNGGSDKHEHDTKRNDSEDDPPPGSIGWMDETRCILYVHGGGYYFGSIDQQRYCMQRYARKVNGRVFAVNYRLAPQYPFPCALQDLLAAYLYLIDPPPDALHAPVEPSQIVFGGDSAGAGLCLAALQVIRDVGLPAPAAAFLVSPWSDLTHSFPSTVQNTSTDIIPPYGLSLHRPSVLWPPPPDKMAAEVRQKLRDRVKKVAKQSVMESVKLLHGGSSRSVAHPEGTSKQPADATSQPVPPGTPVVDVVDPSTGKQSPHPAFFSAKLPMPWDSSDAFHARVDGEIVTVKKQMQFYTSNSLLLHPLVSPVLGYLGGLPPLYVVASDKEVLRDEIIYLAHKAAYPERFPIHEDSKRLYPHIRDIKETRPTFVHLQVYDDMAHVLPMFSFTTPAKYCYRAIAQFVKHFASNDSHSTTILAEPQTTTPDAEITSSSILSNGETASTHTDTVSKRDATDKKPSKLASNGPCVPADAGASSFFKNLGRSISFNAQSAPTNLLRRQTSEPTRDRSRDSGDVAGNRFKEDKEGEKMEPRGPGTAGDHSTYATLKESQNTRMMRERVSTTGVIRPLEPEAELQALNVPPELIGALNENVIKRYLDGQNLWDKKFGKLAKKIETKRMKNLHLADAETIKSIEHLQERLFRSDSTRVSVESVVNKVAEHAEAAAKEEDVKQGPSKTARPRGDSDKHGFGWSWVIDGEHPPASSIVCRRDTEEARRLARVADVTIDQEESKMSGNRLWSVLANFLTTSPENKKGEKEDGDDEEEQSGRAHHNDPEGTVERIDHEREQRPKKSKSLLRRLKSFGHHYKA